MYTTDISDFSTYKSNDNYSLAVDTAVLLYKISTLVANIEAASGTSFQDEIDAINASLTSILAATSNIDGYLNTPSSTLLSLLADSNANVLAQADAIGRIDDFLTGQAGGTPLATRWNIPSLVSDVSALLVKLNTSLDNPSIVSSVDAHVTHFQSILTELTSTKTLLNSVFSTSTAIRDLLASVDQRLASSNPLRNIYPNFMSLAVPSYPGVQLYRFPSTMTSLSFTLINPPASPDTLNTYALYSFKIDDIFIPNANNCPPCPDDASVFDSWYPLFFGAEETHDALSIPSDKELVFQISSMGATADLKLAVKFWTSQPFLPSVPTIPAP